MIRYGIVVLILSVLYGCSTEESATKDVQIYPWYSCRAEFSCRGKLIGEVTTEQRFSSEQRCADHLKEKIVGVSQCGNKGLIDLSQFKASKFPPGTGKLEEAKTTVKLYPRNICNAEFRCNDGKVVGKVRSNQKFTSKQECVDDLVEQIRKVKYCANENMTEENLVDLRHRELSEYENFVEMTELNGFVPYNQNIPEKSWKYIFQEKESGMQVTNYLGDRIFEDANQLCESLNGGTAKDGWRLPDKGKLKFLAEKKVANVSELGNLRMFFWSSSSVSLNSPNAWYVNLANVANGYSRNILKTYRNPTLCVRKIVYRYSW